jgi:hypothetical protein
MDLSIASEASFWLSITCSYALASKSWWPYLLLGRYQRAVRK